MHLNGDGSFGRPIDGMIRGVGVVGNLRVVEPDDHVRHVAGEQPDAGMHRGHVFRADQPALFELRNEAVHFRRAEEQVDLWHRVGQLVLMALHHAADADDRFAASGVFEAPRLDERIDGFLLRGVNDNADALIGLSRRLIDLRVMPYYLHQLDRVTGAAHFEVPITRGQELIAAMRHALPGYAVPRYVQETAGEAHKRVLA